jgi:hypothetical protein
MPKAPLTLIDYGDLYCLHLFTDYSPGYRLC